MSWLRRQKHEPEPLAEEPAAPAAAPYVPASMRPRPITVPPSMQDDDVDPDDGQIAFLASLAQEVDRERAPDAPGVPAASATRTDGDALWAFRDAAPAFDPYDGVRRHVPAEVAIDDLLDELSMTAAALRRRRAA